MSRMTPRVCENCSNQFRVKSYVVRRGGGRFCSKSCAVTGANGNSYRHGNSTRLAGQSKEYRTWANVKQRTTVPGADNSAYYIDRGIKMCDRWLSSFENFLADMGPAPSPAHSIERIDNDGDYKPGNCKWATHREQMANTRLTKHIDFNGERHTQDQWGDITGLGGLTILKSLKRGWTVEQALTLPKRTYITKQGTNQ